MPRKHLIVGGINKKQQTNAKLWQKLSREIKAATKFGGSNPEANPKLKFAIERALKHNLSQEAIFKNIHGSEKDTKNLIYEEYEIVAAFQTKAIISVLTDNSLRTVANIKSYISKINGQITKMNAIKIFFEHVGFFNINKTTKITEEKVLEILIDYPINHLLEFENHYELLVPENVFYDVKKILNNNYFEIEEAAIKWLAHEHAQINDKIFKKKLLTFLEQCEEDEDIQTVFINVKD